ncbi:MAG: phosphoheptose isomerase, partial [Nitrospinota bacterium]
IGLTGENGGRVEKSSQYTIKAPSDKTPRIQEAHILICHIICEIVEKEIFGSSHK